MMGWWIIGSVFGTDESDDESNAELTTPTIPLDTEPAARLTAVLRLPLIKYPSLGQFGI